MNDAEFKLREIDDSRLAVHATSDLPAWLWSTDGIRILWANAAGAKLFGAAKTFGPADLHRRQVAQLAGRLPLTGATRLERLRGFGSALGTLVTCACARLDFSDGGAGILVVAILSPGELQRLERAAPPTASSRSAAPEPPTGAVEASGHLVVEPLPESAKHAEIAPTHRPDLAAMDQR